MEWIDFETALPPAGVDVLLSFIDGTSKTVLIGRVTQYESKDKPMMLWAALKGNFYKENVNGWMHKPKPRNL